MKTKYEVKHIHYIIHIDMNCSIMLQVCFV